MVEDFNTKSVVLKKANKGLPLKKNTPNKTPDGFEIWNFKRHKFFSKEGPFGNLKNGRLWKAFCCNFEKKSEFFRMFEVLFYFQLSKCILTWIHCE